MGKSQVVDELLDACAVAVLRAPDTSSACNAAEALLAGGIRAVEVTMTVPNATEVIRTCARLPGILIGAGTVLTPDEVGVCADAGARFIVSPAFCPDVLAASKDRDLPTMAGAMTPTEALNGWRAGADFIKIFPASRLGPRFLADLRGPYPTMRLAPTGGLNAGNASEYLDAGACVLGFGSWLIDRSAMADNHFEVITERARDVCTAVSEFRKGSND